MCFNYIRITKDVVNVIINIDIYKQTHLLPGGHHLARKKNGNLGRKSNQATNVGAFPTFNHNFASARVIEASENISHRIHGAGIYANIWGIDGIHVTIYSIHGSYGYIIPKPEINNGQPYSLTVTMCGEVDHWSNGNTFHEVIRNTSEGLHEPEGTEKNEHESYHLVSLQCRAPTYNLVYKTP